MSKYWSETMLDRFCAQKYLDTQKIMNLQWKLCFIDHPCNVCCCFGAFWPWTLTLTTLNVKISIWNHARSILRSKIHIYAENFDFTMKNVGFINHFLNCYASNLTFRAFSDNVSKKSRGWISFFPNFNWKPVLNSQKIGE